MNVIFPDWVSNEKKYERAIAEIKKLGQPVTDETIKALYVKYGGLVVDVSVPEPETAIGGYLGVSKPIIEAKKRRTR